MKLVMQRMKKQDVAVTIVKSMQIIKNGSKKSYHEGKKQ